MINGFQIPGSIHVPSHKVNKPNNLFLTRLTPLNILLTSLNNVSTPLNNPLTLSSFIHVPSHKAFSGRAAADGRLLVIALAASPLPPAAFDACHTNSAVYVNREEGRGER